MEAWVAGASGLVGRTLVGELCTRPGVRSVTTLVRRAEGRREARLEERVVAFDALALELAGRTATHVFCCLGTTMAKAGSEEAFRRVDYHYPLALGRAARAGGARKVLVVTAVGADPKSGIFYNRVKGEVERDLTALGFPELHIFRPSLMLGERNERRPAEKLAMAVSKPIGALLFGGLKKYRPIAGSSVARAMATAALDERKAPPVSVYEYDGIVELAGRPSSTA